MTRTDDEAVSDAGFRVVIEDGVATLIIDRPGTHNPITYKMWRAIPEIMTSLDANDRVRVIAIRGAGPHFSAGADIKEFAQTRRDGQSTANYNDAVTSGEKAIRSVTKPTIAVIRGSCVGGGCEIALACDLRIAASTARFGITPSRLGIIFPFTSTKILVDTVGPARAKYLLFTAVIVDAHQAYELGLVNQVVEENELDDCAADLIATIRSRSLQSVKGAKLMIHRILDGQVEADDELLALSAMASDSADYHERVGAFLGKRV